MRHIEEWLRTSPKQERWGCPAQVSGSSTGAPLLLLAEEQELEAVRLWLASAAPKYEATQKEDAVKSRNVTWIFHEFSACGDTSRGTYSPSRNCTCMFWLNTARPSMGTCSLSSCMIRIKQELNKTPILAYMNLSWLPRHRFKLCNLFPSIPQSSMLLCFALPGFPSKTRL